MLISPGLSDFSLETPRQFDLKRWPGQNRLGSLWRTERPDFSLPTIMAKLAGTQVALKDFSLQALHDFRYTEMLEIKSSFV